MHPDLGECVVVARRVDPQKRILEGTQLFALLRNHSQVRSPSWGRLLPGALL